MRFWDSSALLPLVYEESASAAMRDLLKGDRDVAVWWGGRIECVGGLSRRWREGSLETSPRLRSVALLDRLWETAIEVSPSNEVRARAEALLGLHPLRAADALQLAAAVAVFQDRPGGTGGFVCLDDRLRWAASREGFRVLPEALR